MPSSPRPRPRRLRRQEKGEVSLRIQLNFKVKIRESVAKEETMKTRILAPFLTKYDALEIKEVKWNRLCLSETLMLMSMNIVKNKALRDIRGNLNEKKSFKSKRNWMWSQVSTKEKKEKKKKKKEEER